MGKLTDRTIRAAEAGEKDAYLYDGDGLTLRIGRTSGRKTFFYRYKKGNSSKWVPLGEYPALALKDARLMAQEIDTRRKQGIDPIEAREQEAAQREAEALAAAQALAASQARVTVEALFERWMRVDVARRKDGGAEVRRMFEKDVLPVLGKLSAEDVRKGHITGVTDALLARGVPRMAKVVFSLMRQMFRFAVDRDVIEFDPTASLRKASVGGKEVERDRVLSEDEIRALVHALPAAGLRPSTQAAVWLALATCCRIGELLCARWEHIDVKRATWWIPPDVAKNGRGHVVALSPFAVAQFEAIRQGQKTPSAWVFPNRKDTDHVCPKTITKQLGDRQRADRAPMSRRVKANKSNALMLPGGRWGPHDLRRTGATMMVALGVLPEVAERCLNHTEQNKVKRVYQRHSYEGEMRQAWCLLGERLKLLTHKDAGNVVTLHRAA